MPIPDYQSLMKPILDLLADGHVHVMTEITDELVRQFNLSVDEASAILPSGKQRVIDNRIGWAKTYLTMARLVERHGRGFLKITPRGAELIKKNDAVNNVVLKQYPEFLEFLRRSRPPVVEETGDDSPLLRRGAGGEAENTPEEALENSHRTLNESLKDELLEKIKSCTPRFFENLIVDLLLKMGYGGSRKDAGKIVGKSGDGGIDGIIKEDKLGLDTIYLQAKKYEDTVPIGAVRDFAGALLGTKARKGIMITTSGFPKSAHDYVKSLEQKIILIDGDMLTDLMIEHNTGTYTERSFEIKKMDLDYFDV